MLRTPMVDPLQFFVTAKPQSEFTVKCQLCAMAPVAILCVQPDMRTCAVYAAPSG